METFVNFLLAALSGVGMGAGILGIIFLSKGVESTNLPKLLKALLTVFIYLVITALILGILAWFMVFILKPAGEEFILYFITLLASLLFVVIYALLD
ncbi:MAG: hypothetical protein LBD11_00750 [Candidatus Peribacteria bacterium]|nr:hypothetical protein [Candidatus Peribacteria bacterium]